MFGIHLLNTDLYDLIHWFFLYSFLGWVIECIVISMENRHFTNRGFLYGPFCIVYGFGALIFYFLLRPFARNYMLLFLGGMVIASVLELFTAKLMIRLFGAFWWDYSKKPFNYKGILCLESSLAWGVLTVCLFAFIHRAVANAVTAYPHPFGEAAAVVLVLYLVVDFSISLYQTVKYGEDALPENALTAEDIHSNELS